MIDNDYDDRKQYEAEMVSEARGDPMTNQPKPLSDKHACAEPRYYMDTAVVETDDGPPQPRQAAFLMCTQEGCYFHLGDYGEIIAYIRALERQLADKDTQLAAMRKSIGTLAPIPHGPRAYEDIPSGSGAVMDAAEEEISGVETELALARSQLAAMREAGKPMAEVCDFLPGREHLSAAWRKAAGG